MDHVRQIKEDFRAAELDPPTRALLEYAEKVAVRPWEVTRHDIDGLRAHGFSDRDITDAVHNIAVFAYINRVGHGLGVELEPFMLDGGENIAPDQALE